MPDQTPPRPGLPESRTVVKTQTRLSVVWIVPIIAALVGIWVAVAKVRSEGPTITIVFDTAEGLEAGKTKVHYNGVDVGTVTTIRLSDDHRQVVASVEMAPDTKDFLVEGTRFWVVRPRISGANVTGLGTLISGAYIGMEIGAGTSRKHDFVGLAVAPIVTRDVPGRYFVLHTPDLGSLDYGTPLFYRRLQVGEVVSYQLAADGHSLTVRVFVNAPYDHFVTPETRFWHASGVDMSLSANGLSVQTQSALSILIGGVAFATPPASAEQPPADAETGFTLFSDRAQAFRPARGDPQTYELRLTQSVRGLTRGAPVEFRGFPVGEVTDMRSDIDEKTFEFYARIIVNVYPEMFGGNLPVADLRTEAGLAARHQRLDTLIARGLRAQLRSGSMLTGAMYVALDFFPDAAPVTIDWSENPVRIPVVPGEFEAIEASITRIIKKLDKVPVEAIGNDLAKALVDLRHTLGSAERTLDTAGQAIAPNSTLQTDLATTLQEVNRAARAASDLLDYLERHPEALIRGKTGEGKQ